LLGRSAGEGVPGGRDPLSALPRPPPDHQIIAFINEPTVVARILSHLGIDDAPAPRAAARAPPQSSLPDYDDFHDAP